jgi:hypothetical protein
MPVNQTSLKRPFFGNFIPEKQGFIILPLVCQQLAWLVLRKLKRLSRHADH